MVTKQQQENREQFYIISQIIMLVIIIGIFAVSLIIMYNTSNKTNNEEIIKPILYCREGDKMVYETRDFIVCEDSELNEAYISSTLGYAKKMVDNYNTGE